MHGFAPRVLLAVFVCAAYVNCAGTQEQPKDGQPDTSKADEELLRKHQLPTDRKGLLQYFRERTFPEANAEQMATLVKELGSQRFPTREAAYKKILAFGSGALFSLKKHKDVEDAETRTRIQQLLQRIEDNANPAVQAAVARLVAHRKPEGSAEVLMNYLPFAADESVIEEIRDTLTRLAKEKDKVAPPLVAALKSKLPLKRRVAGEALVRAKLAQEVPAVRELLKDQDPRVRMRVALALAEAKEKDAFPVLIDVLAALPPEELWPAENLLVRLAGENTPEISLGTTEADRKKARDAWKAWWDKLDAKVLQDRLAKLDKLEDYLGFTLVIYNAPARVVGGVFRQAGREVLELGPKKDPGQPRWSFTIVNTFPVDVEVIGPKKILLTEYNGRRISIRDFDGRILQTKYVNNHPISADKLPNGNIFVATNNRLIEFDRNLKEVWSHAVPNVVFRASKGRNGIVVYIDSNGNLNYLDPKTRNVIKSFQVGQVGGYYGGLEVLSNGNVLVPQYSTGQVAEFNPQGQVVWRVAMQWPSSVSRLPNGNVLIGSINTNRLVELNRQGQEVRSINMPGQVYRVRVR